MKNALYFRGDVSVGYSVRVEDMEDLSGEGKVPLPEDNIELHEQAYLGEGISYPFPGKTDHAVAIVGWGPCQVTHVSIDKCVEVVRISHESTKIPSHLLDFASLLDSAKRMKPLRTNAGLCRILGDEAWVGMASIFSITIPIVMEAF